MAQSKTEKAIWSDKREEKSMRDMDIFFSYHEMISSGSMKLVTNEFLSEKFGVTTQTIYNINKRMDGRLEGLVKRYPQFEERYEAYKQSLGVETV